MSARVGATATLLAVAALVLAVLALPGPLASLATGTRFDGLGGLRRAAAAGLVHLGAHGDGHLDPSTQALVGYWRWFHLAKAALAATLLALLVRSGRRLVPASLLAATLLVLHWAVGLLALMTLVANIQGALVPLSSALGLAPLDPPSREVALAVDGLVRDLGAGAASPTLDLLLDDFVAYHAVMVALAAVVALGCVALSVRAWRQPRRAGSAGGRRRLLPLAAGGVGATLCTVVTLANLSTVRDPVPALVGFLGGGG